MTEVPVDRIQAGERAVVRFQVMPGLTATEVDELTASIRTHGVLVPILKAADGSIVAGHHRAAIAERLGVECPAEVLSDDRPDAELRSMAFELNLHRRHLTREDKRRLLEESLRADPQLSNREHGRRVGVNHETAGAARGDLEESGGIRHFDRRVDPRSGEQSQPASKPPRPSAEPVDTPPADDEPAEPSPPAGQPDYEELDRQLEERMAGTAQRFRTNWASAVCRAGELRTFDLDRAVEVCERRGLELNARAWREWAADLEQRLARSHLRVIGGRDE